MSTPVGRVVSIRAFPVKSMDAGALVSAQVHRSGVQDDRGWAVVDAAGDVVTARTDEVLRTVVAAVGPDGPELVVPGHDGRLTGTAADHALSALLGRPVRVQAGETFTEVAPIHLVSRQAIAHGHEQHAEDERGECPCSVEEPRANLVLHLDGDQLETGWVGVDLVVGGATLRVSKAPRHCLGVYADVLVEGAVRQGDAAVLLRD